jgi:hypothetical protein
MSVETKTQSKWSVSDAKVEFKAAEGVGPTTYIFDLLFKNSDGQVKPVRSQFKANSKVPNGPGLRALDDPNLDHYRSYYLNTEPKVTVLPMTQPDPKTGKAKVSFVLQVESTIPEARDYTPEEQSARREFYITVPFPPPTNLTAQSSIKVLAKFEPDGRSTTLEISFPVKLI